MENNNRIRPHESGPAKVNLKHLFIRVSLLVAIIAVALVFAFLNRSGRD